MGSPSIIKKAAAYRIASALARDCRFFVLSVNDSCKTVCRLATQHSVLEKASFGPDNNGNFLRAYSGVNDNQGIMLWWLPLGAFASPKMTGHISCLIGYHRSSGHRSLSEEFGWQGSKVPGKGCCLTVFSIPLIQT